VDLEREARFHSSPRRADRGKDKEGNTGSTKRAPGGRNRATPVKLRPGNGPPGALGGGPSPAVVAQKPTAGALLGLALVSAVPPGASMAVVSGAVVLTQTAVLIVNIQVCTMHPLLKNNVFIGSFGTDVSARLGRAH